VRDEESIFAEALRQDSSAGRATFLDCACGDDGELRRSVERLLAAHDKTGGMLEVPPPGLTAATDPPSSGHEGSSVGPYKLLERIGDLPRLPQHAIHQVNQRLDPRHRRGGPVVGDHSDAVQVLNRSGRLDVIK
jgi:hypothetical protein